VHPTRVKLLACLAKHGRTFEHQVCSPALGRAAAEAGLVDRSGRTLSWVWLELTDAGRAALQELPPEKQACSCYTCTKQASPAAAPGPQARRGP
jgi:hypothetical protein